MNKLSSYFKKLFSTPDNRQDYNNQMHSFGRIFSGVSLAMICLVPIAYCISAGVMPDWEAVGACAMFMLGYIAIGLIEAVSYAPLLGTTGQYLSFITGNIANLKLPCAINSQSIAKLPVGSEENEIVTAISISVSSIVTTLIIAIGLIPLTLFGDSIVVFLQPVSPYVIPAIFGGLTMVLIAKYYKLAVVPFGFCALFCLAANLVLKFASPTGILASICSQANSQSTMVVIGMVISCVATAILYKKGKV